MVKNLIERTRARLESRKVEDEQGSLILDILIGMAIFALIAIIAVSAVSQYRERAYVQGATSDANALGLALEAGFTDNFAYPGTVTNGTTPPTAKQVSFDAEVTEVLLTGGNSIDGYRVDTSGESFALCVEHASGGDANAWAVYNSAKGGLVDSGRGEGCDAADAVAALAAAPVV